MDKKINKIKSEAKKVVKDVKVLSKMDKKQDKVVAKAKKVIAKKPAKKK